MSKVERVKIGSFNDFVEHLKRHGDIKSLEQCDLNKRMEIIMGVLEKVSSITNVHNDELILVCLQEVDVNFKKGHKFNVFATGKFGDNLKKKLLQKGDFIAIRSPAIENSTGYWTPADYSDKQVWVGNKCQAEAKMYYAKNSNRNELENNFTNDNMMCRNIAGTSDRDSNPQKEIEKRTSKRKESSRVGTDCENSLQRSNFSCEIAASDLKLNDSSQLSLPCSSVPNTLLSGPPSEHSSNPRIVSRSCASPSPKLRRNFSADVSQTPQMSAAGLNLSQNPHLARQVTGSNENEQEILPAQNSVPMVSQMVHPNQNQSQILQPTSVPTTVQHLPTSNQTIFGILSGAGTSYMVKDLPTANCNFPASSVTPMVNNLSASNQNLFGMPPVASTSYFIQQFPTASQLLPASSMQSGVSSITANQVLPAFSMQPGVGNVITNQLLPVSSRQPGVNNITANQFLPALSMQPGVSNITANQVLPDLSMQPRVSNITPSQFLPASSIQPSVSNLTASQSNFGIPPAATAHGPDSPPSYHRVPQMLQATCAPPMVHQVQGCNSNVPGLRSPRIDRRSHYVFSKITDLIDDINLRFNVYGLISSVTEDQLRVDRHMMIHIRDETCPSDGEFRVHVYFSGRSMQPKLEPNLIVRLMKLKVETYNNYLDGRVFSGADVTTFPEMGDGTEGAECPSKKCVFNESDLKRLRELRKWLNSPEQRSQAIHSGLQYPQLFRTTYLPSTNLSTDVATNVTPTDFPSNSNPTPPPQHQGTRITEGRSSEISLHSAVGFETSQQDTSEFVTAQSSEGSSTQGSPSTVSFISDMKEEGTYTLVCQISEVVYFSEDLLVLSIRDGTTCKFHLQGDIQNINVNIIKPSASVRRVKAHDIIKIIVKVQILYTPDASIVFTCNGSDEDVHIAKEQQLHRVQIKRKNLESTERTVVWSEKRKKQLQEESSCEVTRGEDHDSERLRQESRSVGSTVSRINEVQGINAEQISRPSSATCCNEENGSPEPDLNFEGYDNCDETYSTEFTVEINNVKEVDFSCFEDQSNSRNNLYLVHCHLTQVEPSLTRDMVRAYCEICKNWYCWCREGYDTYCSCCLKEGKTNLLKMCFFIKLHLIDRNEKKLIVYMCNQNAVDFLDCSVRSYLQDEMKFREVNEFLSRLMYKGSGNQERPLLKLLIQEIRMVNKTIYMLIKTKVKRMK